MFEEGSSGTGTVPISATGTSVPSIYQPKVEPISPPPMTAAMTTMDNMSDEVMKQQQWISGPGNPTGMGLNVGAGGGGMNTNTMTTTSSAAASASAPLIPSVLMSNQLGGKKFGLNNSHNQFQVLGNVVPPTPLSRDQKTFASIRFCNYKGRNYTTLLITKDGYNFESKRYEKNSIELSPTVLTELLVFLNCNKENFSDSVSAWLPGIMTMGGEN